MVVQLISANTYYPLIKKDFPLYVIDKNFSYNSINEISVIKDIETLPGQINFILFLQENLKIKIFLLKYYY